MSGGTDPPVLYPMLICTECDDRLVIAEGVELMAIRRILLPLQLATTAAATFSAAIMVARLWRAHLAVLHTAANRDRERAARDLFERLTTEQGMAVVEARSDADE